MGNLFAHLRRWWGTAVSSWSGPRTLYAVACRCGHTLRGTRQRRHQVIPCPSCGTSVFILPISVYPAVRAEAPVVPTDKAASGRPHSSSGVPPRWSPMVRLPLLAALATLLVIVIGFFAVWPLLDRRSDRAQSRASRDREQLEWATLNRHLAIGEESLRQGSFALALEEFSAAVDLSKRQPELLSPTKVQQLHHLYWQSDILANRLDRSLESLLEEAHSFHNDAAWAAHFKRQYQGKAILIDDVVRRNLQGKPALRQSEVRSGKLQGRKEVDDLQLLEHLPLDPPQRWLFGAKLESFVHEGDEWVIRFERSSGRLLADFEALAACRPQLRSDPTLPELLARQERQLRQLLLPEP